MKTIANHTEKEFRFGIMVVILIIAIFSTIRVRELQIQQTNKMEETRTNRIESNTRVIPVLPFADAKLIEEPVPATNGQTTMTGFAKTNEVSVQLKTWISDKSYWEEDATGQEKELTVQLTSWMKEGTYWKAEVSEQEPVLASQLEAWISNGAYWNGANE